MKRYHQITDTAELILWNVLIVVILLCISSRWMNKAVDNAKRQAHNEARAKYGNGYKDGYQQGLNLAAEQFAVKGELPNWKTDRNIYVED